MNHQFNTECDSTKGMTKRMGEQNLNGKWGNSPDFSCCPQSESSIVRRVGGQINEGKKIHDRFPRLPCPLYYISSPYVDKMRFIFFGSVLLKQIAAQFRRTRRRKMILLFLLFPEKLTNMVLKRCVAFR